MTQPHQPFRFLDLPPEIRTKIYLLLTSSPTRYVSFSQPYAWIVPPFSTFPYSLVLTCTQLYHEVRPIFFSSNNFTISIRRRNTDWEYFLSPTFQHNIRQIRTLRLAIQRWGTKDFFSKRLVPVVEDCILNGRLRILEVLVKDSYLSRIKDMWKGEEGDENENWRALRRICQDPYLESVTVRAGPLDLFGEDLDGEEVEKFLDVTNMIRDEN